uniref:Possible tRNA binding domain-containing protein n=1 Tax=Panagrolaimus davidi TaxID=227884 RepID=A0A914PNZ9_9BILA
MFIRNYQALTEMRQKCKRKVWAPKQLRLVFSNRDLRRLFQHCKNMVDHHLITDLVSTLVSVFFTENFAEAVNLNAIQSAILLAIGLQHETVDELAPELNLPVNQNLAIFLKGIRTLFDYLDESFLNGMEEDIEGSRKAVVKNVATNDENMGKLRSLDENFQEGEERVKRQQKKIKKI